MSLLSILITVILLIAVLYLFNKFVPVDMNIKKIINAVTVIMTFLWILNELGVFSWLSKISIGS